MKLWSVIQKSIKEQIRSYWILLLTLAMGPFFIFVYYLIVESSKPDYDIVFVNYDLGVTGRDGQVNYGESVIGFFTHLASDSIAIPLKAEEVMNEAAGIEMLKEKKADALIVIPETFSTLIRGRQNTDTFAIPLKITGDLTSTNYLISAIWANELLNEYLLKETNSPGLLKIKEIPLGISGSMSDFDMIVPGILILSLIMLMFTASIAFVSEVENKTIMRLKLSGISVFDFLGGIGIVQSVIGIFSMLLTLLTAILLGFQYEGSLIIMILIAGLTSMSIIAFSLIIAAITRSANEVLIVGNFPMFLFMFFTGAAFPMKSEAIFTIAGYPVSIQGLMTPVHAISALNKTLVMDMDILSILPEITAILLLTVLYFLAGAYIFNRRHLKLDHQ